MPRKYPVVVSGNACRARVEIEIGIIIKIANTLMTHFVDEIAVPKGHVATTDTV